MADSIKISSFDNLALKQLADFIGKDPKIITSDIVNASSKNGNSNDDADSLNKELSATQEKLNNINESMKVLEKERKKALGDIQKYQSSTSRGASEKLQTAQAEYDEAQKRIGVLKIEAQLTKLSLKKIKERQKALEDNKNTTDNIVQNESKINDLLTNRIALQQHLNEIQEESYKKARENWVDKHPKQAERFLKKQERIATQTGKVNEYLDRKTLLGKIFGSAMQEHAAHGHRNSIAQGLASHLLTKAGNAASFIMSDKQVSIGDIGGKVANAVGQLGPWGKAAGALVQGLTAAVEMADRINKSASDYARSVGGGVAKMKTMRTQATDIASAISQWGDKAYKFDKILEHTAELSKETGRVMEHMSNMDFKSLEDLRQWGIDSSVLNQFDTFGLSMETIDKRIKSIYSTSGKQGLNAKAVTDVVTKNLKMAQNYTFAGGLRSLERMAQKSVALKYNMESVSRFADKVSTLEGAATAGAQLSVLGGDFARMGNPLTMLYGGLQDVEQLNEMMLNMTKNMAQWDSDKGQMEITAYNRQRLRAAADAMGVDYSELVNQAMTQGKRNRIDNQLDVAGNINDDNTREYIKNIAQVDEKGKGYVVFHEGGEERRVDVDKLTENDKEKLKEESKRYSDEQNAKLGDVLSQTRTITEQLNDLIDTLRAKIATGIITIYNWLDNHFGDGDNQIDISGISLSGNQKTTYDAAIKARDKGWENLSETEKTTLKNVGITSRAQIAGKSNEELSSIASNPIKTETEKKAHGGVIRGKGTSMSDSIPAMLSNGEFVMNAKATNKHLPTLQAWNADGYNSGTITPIRAGGNQTNPLSVKENISNIGNNTQGAKKLAIEPISINVSGTINLTGGGVNKSLDIKQLLDNNTFISYLTRQIEKSINFSFNAGESKSHMPYYIPMT